MTLASHKAHRLIRSSTESLAERVKVAGTAEFNRYARDPFLHLEEGHIIVLDLETLRPVVFDPWPHQEEVIRSWIDIDRLIKTGELHFRNYLEEKSRQMGITWAAAYVCLWALRWHPVPGMALSLKLDEVADPGFTADSFFGKIKFMAEYEPVAHDDPAGGFPARLRPRLQFTGGNAPIVRSATGGFLTGSGATPDPGRGGRYAYAFLDEHARIPFGRSVQASITRAVPTGRFYNSTPDGEDNEFFRLRERRPRGYVLTRHHWSQHPVYSQGLHIAGREPGTCELCAGNVAGIDWTPDDPRAHRYPGKVTSPWYDAAVTDLDDEQVARELDIDYAASLTARVYAEFSEERHVAAIEIPVVKHLPIELAFDYGYDTTSVVICQDTPREYRVVGEVEVRDTLPEEVAKALRRELMALGFTEKEVREDFTRDLLAIGDPAGEAHQQATGTTLVQEYAKLGFSISSTPRRVLPTIRATRRLMHGRPKELVVSQRCPRFILHAKHNRWPTDRTGKPKPAAPAPQNDEHNHMMRAFAYLVSHKFPLPDEGDAVRAATEKVAAASGKLDPDLGYGMEL